jgi:hypothetical protein
MREFFRGWKRKVGCVTLGLACASAAIWLRSLFVGDGLWLVFSNQSYTFVSADGRVGCASGQLLGFVKTEIMFKSWNRPTDPYRALAVASVPPQWMIPYWSVCQPFTLVSAWLLFSKPRPAKPSHPQPTEPDYA